MGILWGIKFRFNTRNLCPRIHDHPQRLVDTSHINENSAIVVFPSPMLCGAELFVVITHVYFTCAVMNVQLPVY
jgi:hypothetical protein